MINGDNPMKGKRILIVSESQDVLMFLGDWFQHMDFDVVTLSDILHREKALTAISLDGIILDLEMTAIDGLSMLKHLRRLYPSIPVMVLSIDDNAMGLVEAVKEGATDFLLKPIDSRLLREKCFFLF